MCGSENRYIVLFRIRSASFGLMVLAFFGMFIISCDEVERNKTLTFFFDGVPPLEPQSLQEEFPDTNSLEAARTGQAPVWYVHEPRKDCSNCHTKRKQRSFSSQMYLIAPVPKLCYNCHDDYTTSAVFVHGPVAVGQCLFCHSPHKSKIEHLLTASEPELCYQCHDKNTIELIAAHLPKQLSSCTDCHNPHASSAKTLLKDTSSQTNNQFVQPTIPDSASQNDLPKVKESDKQISPVDEATTSTTMPKAKSLSEVFAETRRLIELGRLQQAGEYLEKFKNSTSFTAEERAQIERILGMINSVINRSEQQIENDKQTEEVAELYYSSMAFYRTGQLIKAREGFVKVLRSGLIPESMAKTIRGYISDIDNSLAGNETSKEPKQ